MLVAVGGPVLPAGWTLDATGGFSGTTWIAGSKVCAIGEPGAQQPIGGLVGGADVASICESWQWFNARTTPMSAVAFAASDLTAPSAIATRNGGFVALFATQDGGGAYNPTHVPGGGPVENGGFTPVPGVFQINSSGSLAGALSTTDGIQYYNTPGMAMTGPDALTLGLVAPADFAAVSYVILDSPPPVVPGSWILG